ncbi:hypothetical protein Btru_067838 [Bulinus truncatus]|nr:hypothetical protein Btru_067838 [Bulinus truncatus]
MCQWMVWSQLSVPFYGENCTLGFSSTCKDSICSDYGYCASCLLGFEGNFCEKALVNKFTVTYEDYRDILIKRVSCLRQAFTDVNNRSFDIRCENAGVANRVILKKRWSYFSSLDVHQKRNTISGKLLTVGRNVALRQSAEQTSTDDAYYAKNAVDGNYDGNTHKITSKHELSLII